MFETLSELRLTTSTPEIKAIEGFFPQGFRGLLPVFYEQMKQLDRQPSQVFGDPNLKLNYSPNNYSKNPTAILLHSALAMSQLAMQRSSDVDSPRISDQVRTGWGLGMANLMELLLDMSLGAVNWQTTKYIGEKPYQPATVTNMVRGRGGKRAQAINYLNRQHLIIQSQQNLTGSKENFHNYFEPDSKINAVMRIFMMSLEGGGSIEARIRFKLWHSSDSDAIDLTDEAFNRQPSFVLATGIPENWYTLRTEVMKTLNIGNLQMNENQAQMLQTKVFSDTLSATNHRP